MEKVWDHADMSIVSGKLVTHLFHLLRHKGVINDHEVQHLFESLLDTFERDPKGVGAAAYLRAVSCDVPGVTLKGPAS